MTTTVRTTRHSDRTTFMEVKTMEESRAELNRTIWFVIISDGKPKKEMKQEVNLIKKAGYQIDKCGRNQWEVYNPATGRRVSASVRWREIVVENSYRGTYRINTEGLSSYTSICNDAYDRRPIDFVGILEKPINTVWGNRWLWQNKKSRAKQNYERLQSKLGMVKSYSRDILKTKKEIQELQDRLVALSERRTKYRAEANAVRREIGLKEVLY